MEGNGPGNTQCLPEIMQRLKDQEIQEWACLVRSSEALKEYIKVKEILGEEYYFKRCKEKLNTLAISVMNQWPGVKVRVTEGWDEEGLHASNSLHYEGRAVDITTSDRDRSKYGMLARLAVEAGFDWVYYESRAHIHTSVKSESSSAARSGGCFTGDSLVTLQDGEQVKMSDVRIGDRVLAVDEDGNLIYSEVLLFLDRDVTDNRQFVKLTTESGETVELTASHLIFTVQSNEYETMAKLLENENIDSSIEENEITELSDNEGDLFVSKLQFHTLVAETFAKNVGKGDYLLVKNKVGKLVLQLVTEVAFSVQTGVYAPLTNTGTIIVNSVAASCYAVVDSHLIAHWAFFPLRWYSNFNEAYSYILSYARLKDKNSRTKFPEGIHWYAKLLYDLSHYIVPSHMTSN
ncbi:sonic hedgehog protein-like isoform X2 [Artemia franciscana]|uniref:sonic hedgehog protein-like isoform X2 n=1 Tax=Artemia franciscana TaxID=6661 RepID=UPI0032DB95B6